MKIRLMAIMVSLFVLVEIHSASAEPSAPPPQEAMPPGPPPFLQDEELLRLSSEASALALLHRLSLTAEQRGQIKSILEPVRAEFERAEKAEKKFLDEQVKPRLRQIITDLKAGRNPAPPSDRQKEQIDALRSQLAPLLVKADQAFEKILALLRPEQQEVLWDFRFEEYLGPVRPVHPSRLLGMEPEKLVREIRSAPQDEIDQLLRDVVQRPHAGPADDPRAEKARMFIDLIQKIRAMPKSEFDAKAKTLEQELAALKPPPPPGPGRREGPDLQLPYRSAKPVFDVKRILLSQSFFEAL